MSSGAYWRLRPPEAIERLRAQRAAPSEIMLEGLGQTARVIRIGPDAWRWYENQATFDFRATIPKPGELKLYDASRDMYHHLFLDSGQTFWRIGTSGPWHLHYVVISVK